MSRRQRLVLLIVAVMAILGVAIAWLLRPPAGRVLKLADGCAVILKAVTFGTEHRYVAGQPWFRILAPVIPSKWHSRLGIKVATHKSNCPTLVVWVQWRGGGLNQREFTDASVLDEQGFESEPHRAITTLFLYDPPRGAVRAWEFAHFPRRSETVGLRLYTRGAAYNPDRLAEFQFPNPARQKYPVWSTPPLPITMREGGTEFSLTRFITGEPIPDKLKPTRGWIAPWTTAIFRVTQDGQPADAWTVAGIEASDATGNVAYFSSTGAGRRNGELTFGFNAPLWPEEPAWKLKVEFARIAEFARDELFVVKAVPFPEPGAETLVNTQAVVQGANLTFKAISRSGLGGQFQGIRVNAEAHLHLIPAQARRLILARATDDRGRVVRHMPGYADVSGPHIFRLEVPADARSIDFTFAVPKSRFVEFMARPEFFPASASRRKL